MSTYQEWASGWVRALRRLRDSRIVQAIYRTVYLLVYDRRFRSPEGYTLCRGVFDTFEEAIASAPAGSVVDVGHARVAQRSVAEFERRGRLPSYEYPAMWWLGRILATERMGQPVVLDVGGNIGVHYYRWSKYLAFPDDLRWIVCDLPEMARAGRELARRRDAKGLEFVTSLADLPPATVLHSSGAFQQMDHWQSILQTVGEKPRHLLLNRLPLHQTRTFVTLQNAGDGVFVPQRVFGRRELIQTFVRVGYELVDEWDDDVDSTELPCQPEYSVAVYTGVYMRLGPVC